MFIDTNIYCLATGKPIAAIHDDELGVVLASVAHLPADKQARTLERLTLSSMRPSLAWMQVSPESLDALREAAPLELLAYLLNRLYHPAERTDKHGRVVDSSAWYAARRNRVALWEALSNSHILPDQLDSLLLVLLDIDSRYSLARIAKPAAVTALWESWSEDNASELLLQLWQWHNRLAVQAAKQAREAKAAAEFWSEGNRLTRQALVTQFAKVKPSRAAVERKAKNAKLADSLDFLDQLERELTNRSNANVPGVASGAVASVESPKPAPVKITRFGGFKKSEA